jgi:hypothetical protein
MKVFLSHAFSDSRWAKRIANFLRKEGFEVWDNTQVLPGENWAEQAGEALKTSDAMVVLITPESVHSPQITYELGYALGKKDYKGRLVPVVMDTPEKQVKKNDVPWVLNGFDQVHLSEKNKDKSLREISQALRAAA